MIGKYFEFSNTNFEHQSSLYVKHGNTRQEIFFSLTSVSCYPFKTVRQTRRKKLNIKGTNLEATT